MIRDRTVSSGLPLGLFGNGRSRISGLTRALQTAAARRRRELSNAKVALVRALRQGVARRKVRLERSAERVEKTMRRTLERRKQRLVACAGKLDALSPLSTLRRGYSVALGPAGKVLKRVTDFGPGDRFTLRVQDGRVECEAGTGVPEEGSAPTLERGR